jgi:hypothetical protein
MNILRRFFGGPKPSDLHGRFDFAGDMITGWVEDRMDPSNKEITIEVIIGNDVIASASVHGSPDVGWRFEIPVGDRLTGRDILNERARVFARMRSVTPARC